MKTALISAIVIAFTTLLLAPGVSYAATGSCVACHTDEAMLKSLFKPAAIEGEGEG